jgi:predicted XRE-type DNA-binding protein
MDAEPTVTYSSTDVFHDLGLPDADELLAKSRLACAIGDAVSSCGLTHSQAAQRVGSDPDALAKVLSGRLSEFATEQLLGMLLSLGLDVEIVIHQTATPEQRGTVNVAYR